MSDWFIVVGIIALGFVLRLLDGVLDGVLDGRYRRPRAVMRYAPSPLLVDAYERAAWALLQGLPLGAQAVCPKVRLEDVVRAQGPEWHRLRGHVTSRHIDFLLVDAEWQPMLAVEVDGASHNRPDRAYADAVKSAALKAAGVPLLRLRVGQEQSWRTALLAWRSAREAAAVPGSRPTSVLPTAQRRRA